MFGPHSGPFSSVFSEFIFTSTEFVFLYEHGVRAAFQVPFHLPFQNSVLPQTGSIQDVLNQISDNLRNLILVLIFELLDVHPDRVIEDGHHVSPATFDDTRMLVNRNVEL